MKAELLTGKRLQYALQVTERHVQLRDEDDCLVRWLERDEAISLMLTGMCEAWGRPSRVRYLRAVDPAAVTWRKAVEVQRRVAALPFRDCWKTGGAAVLQPSIEWLREMYPDRGTFVRPQ